MKFFPLIYLFLRPACSKHTPNFIRNIFSCVGAILAHPFKHAVGNGWMCTIIAIVALLSGIVVIPTMKRFGNKWAVAMDKVLEEEERVEEERKRRESLSR